MGASTLVAKSSDHHRNGRFENSNVLDTAPTADFIHQTELFTYDGYLRASWKDFDNNLELLQDDKLKSTGRIVEINVAHGEGLLHRGVWIALFRRRQRRRRRQGTNNKNDNDDGGTREILVMKRAPTLKTCPSAWALVGEHSEAGEPWEDTALRALREEVQLLDEAALLSKQRLVPNASFLVRSFYENVNRYELQATALFAIEISVPDSESLQFDDEVAETKWVPINDLLRTVYMCNDDITDLLKVVVDYMQQSDAG